MNQKDRRETGEKSPLKARKDRLAAQLRDNLRKRKTQAKLRESPPEEGEAPPQEPRK
jgi:hypothetical protein